MATYKVLQDIEAEDKLIGPLTPRQCIYAGIAIAALYMSFLATTKHLGFMMIVLVPVALFGIFFAIPWSKQQPTEVWALAKIRFFLKPRRRIWNQTGFKELVTVTAPKQIERIFTNGLSQTEVHSRLKALADTIDSRGWAIKNVDPSVYSMSPYLNAQLQSSDRLLMPTALPQAVPDYNANDLIDVMDEQNSRVAQQFDSLISASSTARRENIQKEMQQQSSPALRPTSTNGAEQPAHPYWFMGQPAAPTPSTPAGFSNQADLSDDTGFPLAAEPTNDEAAFIQSHARAADTGQSYGHLRVINPPGQVQPALDQASYPEQTPVTAPTDPAILELANNNDWNVATIARQAHMDNQVGNRDNRPKDAWGSADEVVVPLR